MTRREIEACVRKWQRRLGLERWEITIAEEPSEHEGAIASIERSGDYLEAQIQLGAGWQSWTAEACGQGGPGWSEQKSLDRTIAHELLHCRLHDVDHAPEKLLDGMLHRDVAAVFDVARTSALERAIEELARAFCEAYGEE